VLQGVNHVLNCAGLNEKLGKQSKLNMFIEWTGSDINKEKNLKLLSE
jgi:hypothetical protein